MRINLKLFYPFLIIFAVVLILYYPVLTTYFSQDDFFHFKVSLTDGSFNQFINLFGFHSFSERGIAFYRPVSRELIFNIFYSIFGLNHLPLRILQLSIHLVNIFLSFILIQKIFQKNTLSFFVAFFFGISSAHVGSLYYLAGGIQSLLATTFILLTIIFFIDFLQKDNLKSKILFFISFLLAISSHELSIAIPILLIGLVLVYNSTQRWKRRILQLWPIFAVTIIYLYLNITKIGFSASEKQYQAVFNIKTIVNSFAWYTGWAFGLPEMLIDFISPGFKLNPTLMRYWGNYFMIIFPTFFLNIIIVISSLTYLFSKKRIIFSNRKFWFLLIWFPASLIPVIFLPLHKSTYYLSPALPSFWGSLGFIIFSAYWHLTKKLPKLAVTLLIIFASSTFLLIATSIWLSNSTYWAATRGRLAKKLINQVVSSYPTLPRGSAIYFTNDPTYPFVASDWGGSSKQAYFILNGNDAIQLLYKDPTLSVFYQDLGGIPQDFPQDKIYSLVVQIYK